MISNQKATITFLMSVFGSLFLLENFKKLNIGCHKANLKYIDE